jgi:predicted GIY-YIG superfamily endonuclease
MWYYVYILELSNKKHYVGCTINITERFTRHTKGYVPATQPHRPLKLLWCCSFSDRYKAYQFEKYLKSGSGRAFTMKHLL